jgi:CheY-like chemotaxis protein
MAHKILIVDDDKINITIIKFGLAERSYHITTAGNGREGLECVKTNRPDLIILDVHMPHMDGYEFMSELKNLDDIPTPPVIMLTANETMEDMFKLEGVKGYFVKPVELPDLLSKIVHCIGENPY